MDKKYLLQTLFNKGAKIKYLLLLLLLSSCVTVSTQPPPDDEVYLPVKVHYHRGE